jgi:hypothetical protein
MAATGFSPDSPIVKRCFFNPKPKSMACRRDGFARLLCCGDQFAMDQFNPKDERPQLSGEASTSPQASGPTPKQFYKEFVQFAVFLGVTLFPIYLSFDTVTEELRFFIAQYVRPVSNPLGDDTQYVLDKDFARITLVITYLLLFTSIFFARHAIRKRPTSNFVQSSDVAVVENSLIQEKDSQIKRLHDLRQKDMEILRIIHEKLYDDLRPRLDFVSESASYYVTADGTLKVHKDVTVQATEEEGFLWTFNAYGDDESTPLEELGDMHVRVLASDKQTDLLYLPLRNEQLRKEFLIYFLPLLKPGESRAFTLYYEWPGSFQKLLKKGSASYVWKNRTRNQTKGRFHAEWRFDEKLGNVECKNTGDKPPGLELARLEPSVPTRWVLSGEEVPLSDVTYEITFWDDAAKP